jgi:pimeloyl-ACP methyl ester carboxylesterase
MRPLPAYPVYLPGAEPVFGFFHGVGERTPRGPAVLMCTPFGWGEAHSHRRRREWATHLAGAGYPILRLDLPGTGDSGGSPRDPARVAAWTEALGVAAAWLHDVTACDRVAAIGISLGGLVVCCSVAAGAPIDEVVLWAVPSRGRRFLHELRAFACMQEEAHGTPPDDASSGAAADGSIAAGYVLSAETVKSLEDLDLSELRLPHGRIRRALLLERDGIEVDVRLRQHLEESGAVVSVARGEGYGAMMSARQRARPSADAFTPIERWLGDSAAGVSAMGNRRARFPSRRLIPGDEPRSVELAVADTSVRETPLLIDQPFGKLFGVLTEPIETPVSDLCVLLLNAGPIRHIGPNRMWVEAARRWAPWGVSTLRLDLEGLGDSDGASGRFAGDELYVPELVEQVRTVLGVVEARGIADRFALAGLCSGAYWSFHAALQDERVLAAFMINPWALYWDTSLEGDRGLRRRLLRSSSWRKVLRREVPFSRLAALTGETPAALAGIQSRAKSRMRELTLALDRLREDQKHVLLAFSDNEPLCADLRRRGLLERQDRWPNITFEFIPGEDHILQSLASQRQVHASLDRALAVLLARRRGEASMPEAPEVSGAPR